MRRLILVMISIIVHAHLVFAQKEDIKFKQLSIQQGLSQKGVECILQDRQGFMWFGTFNGLNRYDGYRFHIYKNDERKASSLINNKINDIFEDKDGNLWIGTPDGLEKLDREKDCFIHFNKEGTTFNVKSIFQDSDGNIWLATINAGLCLFNPSKGSFLTYEHDDKNPNSIAHNEVNEIIEFNKNELLISTRRGLELFNKTTKNFVPIKESRKDVEGIVSNRVRQIYKDSKGNIWLSMHRTGIALLNRKDLSFTYFDYHPGKPGISDGFIPGLLEADNGKLWIGTENKGLCVLDPKTLTFSNYDINPADPFSIRDHYIRVLYKDRAGNIWIGTDYEGINMMPKGGIKFEHYPFNIENKTGLNNKFAQAIVEDEEGKVWIGTDGGGLNLFDKKSKTFTHFTADSTKNSISGNYIHALCDLGNGQLAIGFTKGAGVDFFDLKSGIFTHHLPETTPNDSTTITGRSIISIYKDHNNNIWIGGLGTALNFFDANKNKFYKYTNSKSDTFSIGSNVVYTTYEDSQHNLWLGTNTGLDLFIAETKKFIHYTHNIKDKNSISSNFVYTIYEDKKGRLWIATAAGLNLFDKKNKIFTVYTEADGLPNNDVKSILGDSKGNLWLGTDRGLSKFNPQTKVFRNYDESDGVLAGEFSVASCFMNKQGVMYFGGSDGFNVFHPDSIKDNLNIPAIVFTDFQIFNKSIVAGDQDSPLQKQISETKEISLAYWQSVFTLEFAALNFVNPEKNKYAYKLDGFDKNWNYVDYKRSATYTNLDAGEYTFRVKASNNDGLWNEKGAAIKIIITPPFWKTLWFRILLFFLIMGSAYYWYRQRINIVEKQKKILEKQVVERTTEVLHQKEELEKQGKRIEGLYQDVKDSIRAAQLIQKAILPPDKLIKQDLSESFILYKPKDIVSGDFYWFDIVNDKIVLAAVDCTGHGVSGALMAINGHHLLNKSIGSNGTLIASEILDRLNEGIIKELHQENSPDQINSGMDIALCIIDKAGNNLQYAGAHNPLYVLRNGEMIIVKANKFAIGLDIKGKNNKFTNNELALQKGDSIYIFSDGFADQLGGPNGNDKFLYSRFRELLLSIQNESMNAQKQSLENRLSEWQGKEEQLDDILVIGFRV